VYNAWHKTELEKWLDDHDIPYPAAADRKDLADAVSKHWDQASTAVYETWDDNRLRTWLEARAVEFDAGAKKDALIDQVKSNWYGAKADTESAWETVKDWVFDSYAPLCFGINCRWSDSHLKAFLDKHGIPCPQPKTRDTLLAKARESYESIRKSAGDTAAAPGNWLFEEWSDSDLKSWCDYRGISVPQGSKRNEVCPLCIPTNFSSLLS
jgi:Putative nuclear envelope organisation protein